MSWWATWAVRTVRQPAAVHFLSVRCDLRLTCSAGEKYLKSLLSKTPQWHSKAKRASTAAECDATGYSTLARVLRYDDTSAALRKRDMIHLARIWGYRCHIWRYAARCTRYR